jgi:hypothetical protein
MDDIGVPISILGSNNTKTCATQSTMNFDIDPQKIMMAYVIFEVEAHR